MKQKLFNCLKLRHFLYCLLTCVLCVRCGKNCYVNGVNTLGFKVGDVLTVCDSGILIKLDSSTKYKLPPDTIDTIDMTIIINPSDLVPPAPFGMKERQIGYKFTDAELAFIRQRKNAGEIGCFMTINNSQAYVSFYGNVR